MMVHCPVVSDRTTTRFTPLAVDHGTTFLRGMIWHSRRRSNGMCRNAESSRLSDCVEVMMVPPFFFVGVGEMDNMSTKKSCVGLASDSCNRNVNSVGNKSSNMGSLSLSLLLLLLASMALQNTWRTVFPQCNWLASLQKVSDPPTPPISVANSHPGMRES